MSERDKSKRRDGPNRLPSAAGMEIFAIKPIILGGDPADPANKAVLTRQQHIDGFATGTGSSPTFARGRRRRIDVRITTARWRPKIKRIKSGECLPQSLARFGTT